MSVKIIGGQCPFQMDWTPALIKSRSEPTHTDRQTMQKHNDFSPGHLLHGRRQHTNDSKTCMNGYISTTIRYSSCAATTCSSTWSYVHTFLCTTAVWQFAINEYVMLCYIQTHCIKLCAHTQRINWTEMINVLHPSRHKTGHFGDALPRQSLGLALKKVNPTKRS